MNELTKSRWQKRHCHEAHDGDISDTFCGREFKDICTMVLNFCIENPTRDGRSYLARRK